MSGFGLRMLALGGAGALAVGMAAPAVAGTSFGVSVSTNSCGVNAQYSTQSGGGVIPNAPGPCSMGGAAPTRLGLTSAKVSISSTYNAAPEIGATGAGTAAASLSTASLHASSSGGLTPDDLFGGSGPGNASQTSLWDTLTFSVAGASSTTVTTIPFTFEVDGSASDPIHESWSAFLQLATHGCEFNGCGIDTGGTLSWDGQASDFVAVSGNIGFAEDPEPISVTWQTPKVNTLNDLTISGVLSLTGPQAVVDVGADLFTRAYDGSVDYSDTAALSFQAPKGVTLTSASGTFLSGAVPEPSTWAMLIIGFGAVGSAARNRRRLLAGAV